VVSGIGCTGRVAGYVKVDSFHTTHGRAIPFATGLKMARPEIDVVVYSGDGDLISIGGNHLIHAARRNMDLLVICVNNLNYAMTGGQVSATTPETSVVSTAPYGSYEPTFNLPNLAESCGAVMVSRWTSYHVVQLRRAMTAALKRKGFRFIEIISPCPTLYERRNRLGDGLDRMTFFKERSKIDHKADTRDVVLGFQSDIVVGNFVDRERPNYLEAMNESLARKLGDKYQKYEGVSWA